MHDVTNKEWGLGDVCCMLSDLTCDVSPIATGQST